MSIRFSRTTCEPIPRSRRRRINFGYTLELFHAVMVEGESVGIHRDACTRLLSVRLDIDEDEERAALLLAHGFWAGVKSAQERERRRRDRRYWLMKPSAPLREALRLFKADLRYGFEACDLGKTIIYSPVRAGVHCQRCKARHHIELTANGWRHTVTDANGVELPAGSCDTFAREIAKRRDGVE